MRTLSATGVRCGSGNVEPDGNWSDPGPRGRGYGSGGGGCCSPVAGRLAAGLVASRLDVLDRLAGWAGEAFATRTRPLPSIPANLTL